jgi:putative nucleotidyltransferase with HDIG domain
MEQKIDEKKAIELLKNHSADEKSFNKVLAHSKKVQEIALRLAHWIDGVDVEFIRVASLLHDIGRFECPPGKGTIYHGICGARILIE